LVGALILGGAIYFSQKEKEQRSGGLTSAEDERVGRGGLTSANSANCQNLPELPDNSQKLVTKIIDGDTFLIEGGYSVRILGIDADERGNLCYEAAKNRLEELILNKEVKLEKGRENLDQYCRYLRYVFLDDKNISLELAKEGLVVARFSPENIKYKEEISLAEKEARDNKVGCKWQEVVKVEEKKQFQWQTLTQENTGLKVIDACQAGIYYGKEMIVEGKVIATYRSKSDTVFLNFDKPYPNQCFSAVIFKSNQAYFVGKPEDYYLNKTVRIKGKIKDYQGKPEIILENSSQIEIDK